MLHEIDCKPQERSCFLAHEFAVYRGGTDGFPIEDVDIPADVIARGQRPELLTNEFAERALPAASPVFPARGKADAR